METKTETFYNIFEDEFKEFSRRVKDRCAKVGEKCKVTSGFGVKEGLE